jgi:hydrogenase nickel incorporation protein HypA/HybF
MHEFSLAQNIIEIVEETMKKNDLSKVSEVVLEIGTISGVEISALDMALESLREGSVIEKADIRKNIIRARATCTTCNYEFEPEEVFTPCPNCGNFGMDIIVGKEFRVKSITAE